MEVAHTLATNASEKALASWWQSEGARRTGSELTKWFETGVHLRVLPEVAPNEIERLLRDGADGVERRRHLLTAGAFRFFDASSKEMKWAVRSILAIECRPAGDRTHPLWILAWNLTTLMQVGFYYHHYPVQVARDFLRAHGVSSGRGRSTRKLDGQVQAELERVIRFNTQVRLELEKTPIDWQTDTEPWSSIIEAGRAQWGDQLGLLLAGVAGGTAELRGVGNRDLDLDDGMVTVTGRVQAARLNADNEAWWKRQIRRSATEELAVWTLSLLKTFAPSNHVMNLAPDLDRLVGRHAPNAASRFLLTPYPSAPHIARRTARATRPKMTSLPKRLRPETVAILAYGEPGSVQLDLYRKYLASYKGPSALVQRFSATCEFALAGLEPGRWEDAVEMARRRYGARDGELADISDVAEQLRKRGRYQLPRELAIEVTEQSQSFPLELVALAQRRLRAVVLRQLEPVATIATQRGWSQVDKPHPTPTNRIFPSDLDINTFAPSMAPARDAG